MVKTIEHIKEDGRKSIWKFDTEKNPYGPISVEIVYPSDYLCDADIEDTLPITKRNYWNPETETFVGYGRAKQLGLI